MREGESFIVRHADKGKWKISEQELQGRLSKEEANLVLSVLEVEFPDWKETPLVLEGIERSLRVGDELFKETPAKSVLVSTNSASDRARLTSALAVARVAQLEGKYNKEHGKDAKRIDLLQVDEEEIVKMMADGQVDTWIAYVDKIMDERGLTEMQAIVQGLLELNAQDTGKGPTRLPREAAERYREVLRQLRSRVTSEQIPVTIFAAGHSGSLGQIRYEAQGGKLNPGDAAQYCEMFKFDASGKLINTKEVAI